MSTTNISPEDFAAAKAAYRALNDSPMQQRLREKREWFCGAVWWKPGDCDLDYLLAELRRMKEVGFDSVRFHNIPPEWDPRTETFDFSKADAWLDAAEQAGMRVTMHGQTRNPSDAFLAKHGITREAYERSHLDEPAMQEMLAAWMGPVLEHFLPRDSIIGYELMGEPGAGQGDIENDYDRPRFAQWLKDKYGTIEALDKAWNIYPEKGKLIADSFETAHEVLEGFKASRAVSGVHRAKMNYGAGRDLYRYLTDKFLSRARQLTAIFRRFDTRHIIMRGSHQLMVNPAALRWDFGQWARSADMHFSSIHLPWHFEAVQGEVDRPVMMEAKQTRDYFKDGFTSAFETIGGAVQYSGGYGTAMSAGLIRRHVISYLAAGNLSMAFWTWNHRPGGWEAGEYGMTSMSGRLTPWVKEIGKTAKGMARYIDELWEADGEPRVGLLQDWDSDCIYNFEPERHDVQEGVGQFGKGVVLQASRARIGAARALMNQHVPFEYVMTEELLEGIACRYPVLYAPHLRSLSTEVVEQLIGYVEKGGRLVADVQFAFMDPWGKMHPVGEGQLQDRLFGAFVDVIHDARTVSQRVDGVGIEGFYADIVPTVAKVIARFEDGRPAVTEARLGKGTAVLVGFDAARMCWKPGRGDVEAMIGELTMADAARTWRCNAPLAVRRRCDAADHYFLINDGPAMTARIHAGDARYINATDVLGGEAVDCDGTIAVPVGQESATWVRCERRSS